MNYLQKFPFDRLKIDRAFVASLGSSGNTGTIIQSIVALGHALGMKVLAEGVENDEQRVLLRLAGCDEMQVICLPGPAQPRKSTRLWLVSRGSRPPDPLPPTLTGPEPPAIVGVQLDAAD